MDINELQFLPPEHWQQFEDLCLAVFQGVWKDPMAQKNGRGGQAQHGVDIWGLAAFDGGFLHGVQCKGKDAKYGSKVTEAELRNEIEKAKSFQPPLKHWTLVTTAPKDATIEGVARRISADHEARGLFRVQVIGWEDIQSHIRQNPEVIKRFYPDFDPATRTAVKKIGEYVDRRIPSDDAALAAVRTAAEADLKKHFDVNAVTSKILLELSTADGAQRRCDLISGLRHARTFVLEADPGAGKSTALLQIAAEVLAEGMDIVPVVVPLPEFAESQHDFLAEVSSRSSFRDFESIVLERLAGDGRIALLCDGWNELSSAKRNSVRINLIKFRRDYPKCGIVVSTRAMTRAPLNGATTFSLEPPSRGQQLAILQEKVGDQAPELFKRARRIPGLSELLRTPLYLIVLAAIGPDGNLPDTKEEAVRRFIEKQENREEHGEALQNILFGRHGSYLRDIALGLTEDNDVAISQSELRTRAARVWAQLAAAGQISENLEPQHIVDALVSHHILVERADRDGEPVYSFQHQQFQEWYASFFVADCIVSAHENSTTESKATLDAILNAMGWSESIAFAIERLSRKSNAGVAQCGSAILRALAIDPMLGAAMIRRASAHSWELLRDRVVKYAAAWHEGMEFSRALRFMIGTGKPEFSDYVWRAYESEDRAKAIDHMPYGWFSADSLGPHGVARYSQLPPTQRRSLLFDLVNRGGLSGIEFAIEVCRKEPESKLVREVLETLWHIGATSEFYSLLETASLEVWADLAQFHPLGDADGEFRTRLLDAKKSRLELVDGVNKLYLLLELAEAGEVRDPELMIGLLLDVKPQTDSYQRDAMLFERASAIHPQQLSAEILKRVQAREKLPSLASQYVISQPQDQNLLIGELTAEDLSDRRNIAVIGRALDKSSGQTLVRELFSLRSKQMSTNSHADRQMLQNRFRIISDALQLMQPNMLAAALIDIPVSQPYEVSIASELLYRWHNYERSTFVESVDPEALNLLRETVKDWADSIAPQALGNRSHLADLASAIKTIAAPELLTALKKLLDAELSAWKEERARKEGRDLSGRQSLANVGYMQIYRQAFANFEGEAVRDILLQYLGEPDFEVEASFELVRFGLDGERPMLQNQMRAPYYGRVAQARIDRKEVHRTNPVAAAVLDRVDQLLAAGEPQGLGRAVKMATAAIQMQVGERANSIRAVIASAVPSSSLYGLLYVAMLVGEEIETKYLVRGINDAIADAESKKWRWNNEWWRFGQWLKLLALSDDPGQIAIGVVKIPREHFDIYELDGVIIALAYGEPQKALEVLKFLAAYAPDMVRRHCFSDALLRMATKEALHYLTDLLLDPPGGNALDINVFAIVDQLSQFCREHPDIRERFLQSFERTGDQRSASILRYLFPRIIRPDEVVHFLRRCDPNGKDARFRLLHAAVRDLSVVDRPLPGTNAYEREGQDLTSLRTELFHIYESDDPYAGLAGRLLLTIEEQHDEYGKPPSEPRHPDIQSGKPWPRAATVLW